MPLVEKGVRGKGRQPLSPPSTGESEREERSAFKRVCYIDLVTKQCPLDAPGNGQC
jgi:hypothetical protein